MENLYFKKTSELTDKEKTEIQTSFNNIFKLHREPYIFDNQYTRNYKGFSYHVLFYDNNHVVVGHEAYIPAIYFINNKKFEFVNGADLFIEKTHRDGFSFLIMKKFAYKNLKKSGVKLMYGVPDNLAMKIHRKARTLDEIGKMNIYFLPYRLNGINKNLKYINPLATLFCKIFLSISYILSNNKLINYPIKKDEASYNATRYKRMDGNYFHINNESEEFMYKIMTYKGVRTAFLIDVLPKSSKNFVNAVKYIRKHHKKEFDILLYAGNKIPFSSGLIKVPIRFEPKNFHFGIKLFDKDLAENHFLYNFKNWDVNFSSFDLI